MKDGKEVLRRLVEGKGSRSQSISPSIRSLLKLDENDAVAIGSADTLEKAEYGALAASWSLVNDNHN